MLEVDGSALCQEEIADDIRGLVLKALSVDLIAPALYVAHKHEDMGLLSG